MHSVVGFAPSIPRCLPSVVRVAPPPMPGSPTVLVGRNNNRWLGLMCSSQETGVKRVVTDVLVVRTVAAFF